MTKKIKILLMTTAIISIGCLGSPHGRHQGPVTTSSWKSCIFQGENEKEERLLSLLFSALWMERVHLTPAIKQALEEVNRSHKLAEGNWVVFEKEDCKECEGLNLHSGEGERIKTGRGDSQHNYFISFVKVHGKEFLAVKEMQEKKEM